ncbi:MAG: glycosyltransferase [Acidimicrobiia bacterium]|nr:glycosyltransferase [Acidimicrobiia bacterium]
MTAGRALWVTAEPPDRNLGGGSIREAYLLEALATEVETHLLLAGTLHDAETRAALAGVIEVDVGGRPPPTGPTRRRFDDLRRVLVEREPADVIENRPRVRALGERLDALGPFDLVCVEHDRLAPLVATRRAGAGRWALTLQNLPSERKRHEQSLARTRRQRWLYGREIADARRFEAAMAAAYDVVFVPSATDAAALGGRAVVVPNGVDTARFRPTPLPPTPTVVFTGTLSWWPNVEGLTWFCELVLPLVRRQVPDVRVDVVGRQPLPEVTALGRLPGVAVHGDVPSVVPWLERARVAVVPVRIGSGTRLKALEAMAAGRPVVGTSVGLAGLGIEDGVHARVADEPASLAAAVAQVLTDDSVAARLAAAGAELARGQFGWDAIGRRFVDTLVGMVQRQPR